MECIQECKANRINRTVGWSRKGGVRPWGCEEPRLVVSPHTAAWAPAWWPLGGGASDRTGAARPLSGWHTEEPARSLDHPRHPIRRPPPHPGRLIGRSVRLRRLWIQWILILGEVAAAELRLIPSLIPGRDKGAGWDPMEAGRVPTVQLTAVGQ